MAQFKCRIALGNDEMKRPEHVAAVLDRISAELAEMGRHTPHGGYSVSGVIFDVNGNNVGEWLIEVPE